MTPSLASTDDMLATLELYRRTTVRNPQAVLTLGGAVLERGWANARTDEVWTVLEQLAVAAVECGKMDLAEVCATRLSTRFPDSPRVAVLLGTIMEGKGLLSEAKLFYENVLAANESDVPIRKRLIALHLHAPLRSSSSAIATTSKSKAVASVSAPSTPSGESPLSKEKGIELLVEYLDTVYNDAEGWAELASVYASLRLYPQSLTALSHLILLAPHNPYHLLRHAETAYTIGDFPLAYKQLLRVIEMSNGVAGTGGVGRRAAMGVKLCVARFKGQAAEDVADPLLKPRKVNDIDLLVSKLVLDAYASTPRAAGVDVVRKWIGGSA